MTTDYDIEFAGDETNDVCICSQPIHHLFYILHIPSGITFKVGSECVHKISRELYLVLTKGACKFCGKGIKDRRRTPCKNGFCGDECYAWGGYRLSFGKNRGTRLSKIPNGYAAWLGGQDRKEFHSINWDLFDYVWEL